MSSREVVEPAAATSSIKHSRVTDRNAQAQGLKPSNDNCATKNVENCCALTCGLRLVVIPPIEEITEIFQVH